MRARSIIQPWTLSPTALGVSVCRSGRQAVVIAYLVSVMCACGGAGAAGKAFGLPRGWRPHPYGRAAGAVDHALAVADIVRMGPANSISILGLWLRFDALNRSKGL